MKKKVLLNKQYALVTGASKGIGFNYCQELLKKGYQVIAVARNTDSIKKLMSNYPQQEIICYNLDLSIPKNVYKLYQEIKNLNITLVINNAGYGVWDYFSKSSLETELNMLNLNIVALHILTKLFIQKFIDSNNGRVINIGSIAAFVPGPVFASYYASKAYVLSLGIAVNTELKKSNSNVRLITICPGPLKTDFWNRSSNQEKAEYNVKVRIIPTEVFAKKSLAKALKAKKKNFITVGWYSRFVYWSSRLLPHKLILDQIYKYQKSRK